MGPFLHRHGKWAIVGGHSARSHAFDAVVHVGHCSGVLVTPDRVLTSAHCLDGPIEAVVSAGRSLSVTGCWRHPAYKPGHAEHDVGMCRIEAPGSIVPIAIDDGSSLAVGAPVLLAGYGLPSVLARGSTALRVVRTSVVRVTPDEVDVGTGDATACRGDSGGPVLVEHGGGIRVAAITRGGTGAICGSPAVAVPVSMQGDWLSKELGSATPAESTQRLHPFGSVAFAALLVATALGLSILRLRRASR